MRTRDFVQRSLLLFGVVALSVVTALTVERLLDPPSAAAQGQPQVVRASAFELVDDNGAVLARLGAGPAGNGNLALFDTQGVRRTVVAGNGGFSSFDRDGTTLRYQAGYVLERGVSGTPPVNGVSLAPDGAVGMLSGCTGTVTC